MQMLADKKEEAAVDTLKRTFQLEGLKMEAESLDLRKQAGERAETRLDLDVAGDVRAGERLTLDREAGGRAERRLSLDEAERGKPRNLEELVTDRVSGGDMTLEEAFSLMSTKRPSQPKGKTSSELAVGASQKFLAGDVAGVKGKAAHDKHYRAKPAVLSEEDIAQGADVLMTDPEAGVSMGIPKYTPPPVDTTKILAQTFTLAGGSERATPGETAEDLLGIHPGLKPKVDPFFEEEPEVSDKQIADFKETLKSGKPEEQRKLIDQFIEANIDDLPITDWDSKDYSEEDRDKFRNYIRELILKQ
jgi:hypothetical protein